MNNQIQISEQLVTPTLAEKMLKKNTNNRKLRHRDIQKYASDMSCGRWRSGTAETIKIAKSGLIIDGQHRLHAVIKSGKSVSLWVASGLEEEVFDVIDTGAKRTIADAFAINKVANAPIVCSIISAYLGFKSNSTAGRGRMLTNQIALNEYHSRPLFWDNTSRRAVRWYNNFAKLLAPSAFGALYALLSEISEAEALSFMDQLSSGSDITNASIILLRNRIMLNRTSAKKFPPPVINAYIIKTWNAFRGNIIIKHLSYNPETQDYPKPL